MKILLINGSMKKGSTYHIGRILAEQICEEIKEIEEIYLPKALPEFCIGCTNCFMKGEHLCPHYSYTDVIIKAMERADILIFTSPVYVYHVTGQMKAMLDHYGYMWMVHRPNEKMFKKQAVVISTAAGGGMKSTNKDIKDSLTYWGIGKAYSYGVAVRAVNWDGIKPNRKDKITKDMKHLSTKIKNKVGRVTPGLKVRGLFYLMRFMQKKAGFNETDQAYWKMKGWLEKKRPWK